MKPAETPKGAPANCTWLEVVPLKTVSWDYGMLREVCDELDDPQMLDLIQRSMVARIATLSHNGRPSTNPLYFVSVPGRIWLGTSE